MHPKDWLKGILQGKPVPVLSLLDKPADGAPEEFLSAANLWNLIFQRAKMLRSQGLQDGDVLVSEVTEMNHVVDCLVAMVLGVGFWATKDRGALKQLGGDSTSRFKSSYLGSLVSVEPDVTPQFDDLTMSGLIVATSGTASGFGRPVLLSWPNVIKQVELHAAYLKDFEGANRLSVLPKFHCFGLILDLLVGLYQKQTLFLSFGGAQRVRNLLRWVQETDSHIVAMTPRQLWILREQMKQNSVENLTITVHCGGAPLESSFKSECESRGLTIIEGYGQTEAGPGVLMDGRPLGCEVKIVALEPNQANWGELHVKSPTLGDFQGKALDLNGFLSTGDLAELRDGIYIVHGRMTDKLKKTDGTWTARTDVEQDIKSRFSALEAYVIGPSSTGLTVHIKTSRDWNRSDQLVEHVLHRYGLKCEVVQLDHGIQFYDRVSARPGKDLHSALIDHNRSAA